MRRSSDEELIAEAVQFTDELDCLAPTAPDDETVRLPLGTIRKAARILRLVLDDAVEQAAQAKAAHDCVVAADRIIQRLEGRKNQCQESSATLATASSASASSPSSRESRPPTHRSSGSACSCRSSSAPSRRSSM